MSKIPSVDEMVDDLISNWLPKVSEYERDQFVGCAKDDLIQFHHGLGTDIRNAYGLWGLSWEPDIIDGADHSDNHPDAVSMKVITKVWERLQ